MNTVDIAVGVVLLISGVFALVRGFVHEVLAAAGWVLSVLAAFWGLRSVPQIHEIAHRYINKPPYEDYAAGFVVFLVVLIVMSFITHAISRRVQRSALGSTDRALGFAFGLIRGLVLCSLAYMVVSWLIPQTPEVVIQAKSLPLIVRSAAVIQSLVPEHMSAIEQETKAKAREASETAQDLKDGQEIFDKLQSPQPRGADPADDKKLPDYDSKGVGRLIENANGK